MESRVGRRNRQGHDIIQKPPLNTHLEMQVISHSPRNLMIVAPAISGVVGPQHWNRTRCDGQSIIDR